MTQITGKTGLTGLLGSPVAHSISPLMHNYSFQALVTEDGGNAVTPAASQLPSSSTP